MENSPIGSYHKYEIITNSENEGLFYTYSAEFSDYSYNILPEQVPYYLMLVPVYINIPLQVVQTDTRLLYTGGYPPS